MAYLNTESIIRHIGCVLENHLLPPLLTGISVWSDGITVKRAIETQYGFDGGKI